MVYEVQLFGEIYRFRISRVSVKMKAMETLQDLIEEAKVRIVWWGLIIFCVAYFLSSKLNLVARLLGSSA